MPAFHESTLSFSEVSFKLRACIAHGSAPQTGLTGPCSSRMGMTEFFAIVMMDASPNLSETLIRFLVMFMCCSLFVKIHHYISLGNDLNVGQRQDCASQSCDFC